MSNTRYLEEPQSLSKHRRSQQPGAPRLSKETLPRVALSQRNEPNTSFANDGRIEHSLAHLQGRRAGRNFCVQVAALSRQAPESEYTSSDLPIDTLSDAEIAQLVTISLESALLAFSARDPLKFLELRVCDGRAGMQEALANLPPIQANAPSVRREYRKAILFQEVALDLATHIMQALVRYGKAQSMM